MGNIDAKRDWGHAKDYVRMQWLMLQQEKPKDYVIASGNQYSVREFITWAAAFVGITIKFRGDGVNEVGVVEHYDPQLSPGVHLGQEIVKVDPRYFRPAEVETLLGDPSLAKKELGWEPEITAKEMCREMVESDYNNARVQLKMNRLANNFG